MKKTFAVTAAAMLMLSCAGMSAFAEDEALSAEVYVTISDGTGDLPVSMEKITVTDIDGDKALTINDTLYCAHEEFFEGGAAAGYQSGNTDYGLSLMKLWGIENNMGFGFFVNNASAWSLTDKVQDGSFVSAFVYTDTTNWSDTYSWFDVNVAGADKGDTVDLTLSRYKYAATDGNTSLPVADAVILINGEETEYKTDAEGKVSVTLEKPGKNVISAKSTSADLLIVPPAAVIEVQGEAEETTTTEEVTTTAEDTTTEAAETTTEAAATTEAATTSAAATTAKATTAAATTTKAAATTAAAAPKTGDAGTGAAFAGIFAAAIGAFAVRRRND